MFHSVHVFSIQREKKNIEKMLNRYSKGEYFDGFPVAFITFQNNNLSEYSNAIQIDDSG